MVDAVTGGVLHQFVASRGPLSVTHFGSSGFKTKLHPNLAKRRFRNWSMRFWRAPVLKLELPALELTNRWERSHCSQAFPCLGVSAPILQPGSPFGLPDVLHGNAL
jgi:hypothetical protein